tara:strand:- start:271 stop:525 length:255 start_codon:yes stop_codon:yes gene_type:complete
MRVIVLALVLASNNLFAQDTWMEMGGGDKMNLDTGEYYMDMGGDKMNLDTGEYYMDMGDGDMMNLDTGEYHINFGDTDQNWIYE